MSPKSSNLTDKQIEHVSRMVSRLPDLSDPFAEVEFYSPKKDWGILGNFYPAPIYHLGETYDTVEHYYQNRKFWITDPVWAEKVRTADTPIKASKLGSDRSRTIDPHWDHYKVRFMRYALQLKLEQNEIVKYALLATGNATLVYNSPIDYFWGAGRSGLGDNILGELWTELRDEYRENTRRSSS